MSRDRAGPAPAWSPAAGDGVAEAAAAAPSALAVAAHGGAALNFAEWDGRAWAVARALVARGVRPGDRVALRFDTPAWADFAVCHLAVRRAGGVAVLVPPGAAPADARRAVAHNGAAAGLGPPHLAVPAAGGWWATAAELEAVDDAGAELPAPPPPGEVAELLYRPLPLGRPAPEARTHARVAARPAPAVGGALVHGWAPGTAGSRFALAAAAVAASSGGPVVAVPLLVPGRLEAALADHGPAALGLSPPLAAALAASAGDRRVPPPAVTRLVLDEQPGPALASALGRAFPSSPIAVVAGPRAGPTASAAAEAPAAVSQEPMLWHEQLAPGSFNLPCLVRRFRGPLDVAALGAALADLARRHEPLCTTFAAAPGVPRQVVGPPPAPGLPVVDLAGLPADRREGEAGRILAEATTRPFDLVEGPLFEPSLLRLGDGDHVLVVRLHHTVFDDWSVDVFRRDLSALYAARLDTSLPPLPEPAARFTTFARRQRAALDGAAGAAQRSWWRRELEGAPLAVQLPLEGGAGEGAGEPVQLDLPPAVSGGVRALAPRLRATPYMTVLAAFAVVVSRYTGQEDLVLGSVTAHRPGSAVEGLIGCFTKKVPLRLRLGGDPAFPELVARARTAVLGALAHEDVAFDAVIQDVLGPAAAGHGAVPHVAVVFQGEAPRRARLALPGVTTAPFEAAGGSRRERHFSARDDEAGPPAPWGDGLYLGTFVLVSLVDHGDGLSLVARGAFPRPAGRRLLGHLEAVLADVVAAPHRRLSELSLGAAPVPVGPVPAGDPDVVDVRGLRARRSRLEAALSRCPGVGDVALAVRHDDGAGPRLVAYVVPSGPAAPSLAALRRAQWAELPGSLWPAAAVAVAALPRRPDGSLDAGALPPPPPGAVEAGEPGAAVLAGLWGAPDPAHPYWQDLSFLAALAEARAGGLAISDEQVARHRTVETLAADLAASAARAAAAPGALNRPTPPPR